MVVVISENTGSNSRDIQDMGRVLVQSKGFDKERGFEI
jgi:hypothetical protein